jgi:cytidylate kinase
MSSQGDELALQVAQQLGWRHIGSDLINKAARAAGAPQVALAEIDELDFLGIRPSPKEWRAYQEQVEGLIRVLAEVGQIVIVGRGGQVVLRNRPDILHVRVVATLETRAAWLQQAEGLSFQAAEARLTKSDKRRAGYVRRSYKINLNEPTLYHLVLNTSLFDVAVAAKLVIQAFEALAASRTKL